MVTFYSVGGVNLGIAKAVQGVLHFAKPNESIAIAKIKGNDLKPSSNISVLKSQFATSKPTLRLQFVILKHSSKSQIATLKP